MIGYAKGRGRALVLLAAVAALAACALPRSGPNKSEILAAGKVEGVGSHVVPVTPAVVRAAAYTPPLGFSREFRNAGLVGSDDIRPGDKLGLTIWENVDDGLLTPPGANATSLTEVQVDGAGFIFVPYAGRILAAGNSPEALRQIITRKLEGQTPDPQVTVTRLAGDGATVTVLGNTGAQGVFAIERPTRTLSAMLARAGGVTIAPDVTQITVTRGNKTGRIWLKDLYDNPEQDIALRPGDVILVEEDQREFIALGATGQSRVQFRSQTLTALEALAQVGGLNSNLADPTGVFILRNEREDVARAVLGRSDIQGEQKIVYVLDLTTPDGLFLARDFVIRDEDTVYVTEAPFVQWQKTLSALVGTIDSGQTLATAGSNL